MRIDSHQHFWKYNPVRDSWIDDSMEIIRRDFLPSDLKPILERHQMDGCVAVQADQSEEETEFLLACAQQNDFIKGVVGWVDLRADDVSERLEHFVKNKHFKGVRHIVQSEKEDFVLGADFQRGIGKLKDFGLTYDLLVLPNQLKSAIKLTQKFPDQKFVLDHMAKPYIKDKKVGEWQTAIEELSKNPNVHCKVSGMVTEADWKNWKNEDFIPYLDVLLNAFNSERLLYGSDWPVCLLAGNYEEVLGVINSYIEKLSKTEQEAIMGLNACNFYELEK